MFIKFEEMGEKKRIKCGVVWCDMIEVKSRRNFSSATELFPFSSQNEGNSRHEHHSE